MLRNSQWVSCMNKDVFKTLIVEGQEELQEVELYLRPLEFEEEGRYVLVGIRQAGKSYLLYQRARQLMQQGHSVKEMVYINFDDERLLGMTAEDFDLILTSPSCSLTRYRTSVDGNTLPADWPTKNIECTSPEAMPRC